MKWQLSIGFVLMVSVLSPGAQAQNVVEDDGVGIDRQHLEQRTRLWTPQMLAAAANDPGDRFELLNNVMVTEKMAAEVEGWSPDSDPEAYWRYYMGLRKFQRKFLFDLYMSRVEVPDMSELAEERYLTDKDNYARVPEERKASHILFMCPPGCDRETVRPKAVDVLSQLLAGASFEEMVAEHSQDPGSKGKGGKFDRWLRKGEERVDPHFLGGVFEIEEVGAYSPLVESKFGLHIIRLDDLRESHYLSFEDARDSIIKRLEGEYLELAAKDFETSFRLSENARIDGVVMDELFAPYVKENPPVSGQQVPTGNAPVPAEEG